MNISFIQDSYDKGGASIFVLYLAKILVAHGHIVNVYAINESGNLIDVFSSCGITINAASPCLAFDYRLNEILKLNREFNPDIIIANLGGAAFKALSYIIPDTCLRIGMVHGSYTELFDFISIHNTSVDLLLTVSDYARSSLLKRHVFLNNKTKVLRLGISVDNHIEKKPNINCPITVLYCGRITDLEKRVYFLAEMIENASKRNINNNYRWKFIGDGPDLNELKNRLSIYKNVIFLGFLTDDKIKSESRNSDVIILPSLSEGMPLSLIEAMSVGVVPLVSDIPGLDELVDLNCGFRVNPYDVNSFLEVLNAIDSDRELLRRMSNMCRIKIKSYFSIDNMYESFIKCIGNLYEHKTKDFDFTLKIPLKSKLKNLVKKMISI